MSLLDYNSCIFCVSNALQGSSLTSQIKFDKCLSRGLAAFNGNPYDVSEKLKTIAAELGINHKTTQFPEYIDPFNAMAFYNREIKSDKRDAIARKLIEWLDLKCDVPETESAIPTPNYARMSFVDRDVSNRNSVVDSVWGKFRVFVSFADGIDTEGSFVEAFDYCRSIKGMVKDPCRQLAMGLYWLDCDRYISMDTHVENYLIKHNGFDSNSFKNIDGSKYIQLVGRIHETIKNDSQLDSFNDLSKIAYEESRTPASFVDYNPGITKEQWSSLLNDPSVFKEESRYLIDCIMKLGGEASCLQLADEFGNRDQYYNNLSLTLARRVHKVTGCQLMSDEKGKDQYWPILFDYRDASPSERGRYIWMIRRELREAIEDNKLDEINENGGTKMMEYGLNMIFYGPPGTGKTYGTVEAAVGIIDGNVPNDYESLKARYDALCDSNRIRSVTFHQSYGYEEFIEGIKPVIGTDGEGDSKEMEYELVDGIFKAFCKSIVPAKTSVDGIRENPVVWKVSLEGTGDNETRRECMEKGHIRIGFDQYGENITGEMNYVDGGRDVLNAFISKMSIGDIIFSCYSSRTIDAIGVVTGEYEWHDEYTQYKRIRNVRWIKKFGKSPKDIVDMNGGVQMTLSTVYKLSRISISDVYSIIDVKQGSIGDGKYVLIIDEINRGNVSRIFGELITLVEESKRRGNKEATYVELPYSKEKFSVPNNLYIMGTMNTADRSLVNLDTALRRRFDFVERMPDHSLLKGKTISGIDIEMLFVTLNKRIEALYDREHTIGHSFFMHIETMNDLERMFKKNIIPLLQEYFHEDYEKIELVLSKMSDSHTSPFVKESAGSPFRNYDGGDLQAYRVDTDALSIPSNYILLYEENP